MMGLRSKQATVDGFDWSQGLLKGGDVDVPAPLVVPTQQRLRRGQQQQRQPAPQQLGPPLKCPRCYSTNTKFCYYNNYSPTQPRHFCKACRRHWTNGGTLRNVPVGGRRKGKRPKASHQSSAPTSTMDADGTVASDSNDTSATPQLSQQVFPPPSFGLNTLCQSLLQSPAPPPSDYANNGESSSSCLSALLPLPQVPQFDCGMTISHHVHDALGYTSPATSAFPSLLNFTRQDDLAALDHAGIAISKATPWELLPPPSCSSGPSGGSTITTSSGLTVLESSSSSSGYWGSCWDNLTGLLFPDHNKHNPPPLLPPPQDLQLS